MNKKNLFILILVSMLFFAAACGGKKNSGETNVGNKETLENVNKSGFPIVNDPITLDFFVGKSPTNQKSLKDVMAFNNYEEMTNINIKWQEVPSDSMEEKRNLALASGNLPDAFYAADISSMDLLKYGGQGTFVKLNDLIDNYAPNLKKLLDENPDMRKGITSSDGNIYAFPRIMDPDFLSIRVNPLLYINQKSLDGVGMNVPETTEDFYKYLRAVKENEENYITPYGGTDINTLVTWLKGSFGVGNRGLQNPLIDQDPETNEMRFVPTLEGYKELLQYVNKLYSEKLIAQNIFSIEWNAYLSNAAEGQYASTVFYSPDELFGEAGNDFVSGLPMEGPNGERQHVAVSNPIFNLGSFVITSKNENPEATVRWIDHFYSDEGSRLLYMGVEDESYEKTNDGEYEFLDKITNDPEGLSKEQALAGYVGYLNTGAPASLVKQEYFKGSETSEMSLNAVEKLEPYVIEDTWPQFQYTEEENETITSIGFDIQKYVEEMKDKFITGEASFDEWDNYVKTIEKMGLKDYMEVQNKAYERFKK
ncbi:extracellular solute-binding protein [Bacillus sp. SD088]|uniref:extracellular solute-binding protein n=1 Tax=Bacillus sp. SD088 TaxID=2782012 RepID=UPI001A96483D|nr:extracellular solute-binding protein [Bacillus sp. SD088]MBO0991769.1 extracellular solute-binding protein [Bacillus sp. SD088]